ALLESAARVAAPAGRGGKTAGTLRNCPRIAFELMLSLASENPPRPTGSGAIPSGPVQPADLLPDLGVRPEIRLQALGVQVHGVGLDRRGGEVQLQGCSLETAGHKHRAEVGLLVLITDVADPGLGFVAELLAAHDGGERPPPVVSAENLG